MIHGRDLIVKVGGTAVAAAQSCDIDSSCSLIEVTKPNATASEAKCRHYRPDRTDWRVTVSGLVLACASSLLSVGTVVTLTCEVDGSQTDTVSGTAIVQQCRITGAVGQLAKGSFVFQGSGPLSQPSN